MKVAKLGSPRGAELLVSELFAYDDDLDTVNVALLSADYIITADSSRTVTAVADFGIFFIKRNALACLGTVGTAVEADRVGRSSDCLYTLDSLVDVLDNLVITANKHNALGSVKYRGNTVLKRYLPR